MTLKIVPMLGWAAHEALACKLPAVIMTCSARLPDASRLVPTTDPKVSILTQSAFTVV